MMAKKPTKNKQEKEPKAPVYYSSEAERAESVKKWFENNRPLNNEEFLTHITREYGESLVEVISREPKNFTARVNTAEGTKVSTFSLPLALVA